MPGVPTQENTVSNAYLVQTWTYWVKMGKNGSIKASVRYQFMMVVQLFGEQCDTVFESKIGFQPMCMPPNRWFLPENNIKMGDLRYPYFRKLT